MSAQRDAASRCQSVESPTHATSPTQSAPLPAHAGYDSGRRHTDCGVIPVANAGHFLGDRADVLVDARECVSAGGPLVLLRMPEPRP